jgi:hypothetical protein
MECPLCLGTASEKEFVYESNKLDKETKEPISFKAKVCYCSLCGTEFFSEDQEHYIDGYLAIHGLRIPDEVIDATVDGVINITSED